MMSNSAQPTYWRQHHKYLFKPMKQRNARSVKQSGTLMCILFIYTSLENPKQHADSNDVVITVESIIHKIASHYSDPLKDIEINYALVYVL